MANSQSIHKHKKIQIAAGQRFGRWMVIVELPHEPCEYRRVVCRCECGTERIIKVKDLVYHESKSCGCYQRDVASANSRRHGESGTRLYALWSVMRGRCENLNNKRFVLYGGRSISVCAEWHDYIGFREWALANGYERTLTIDRISNDGDYEPANCRWVTWKMQCRNKRTNLLITAFGEIKCLADWAEDSRCVVSYDTLQMRIRRGMLPEPAIITPKMHR